jgi:hypothetical protein
MCCIVVHMNNVVNISDFRSKIFDYIEMSNKNGKEISITKDKELIGWFVPKKKTEKKDIFDKFLGDIGDLQKKYPIKGGKSLSQDIDKILYGKK